MNFRKDNIIYGETHCDTVGDFFKNPYILRILRKWYRKKYEGTLKKGKKLQIWTDKNLKEKNFTQEFVNFVKNIFRDEQDMEDFFSFVRAEYYDDVKKREKITDIYNPGQLTTAILAMREVAHQLGYFNAAGLEISIDTVKGIFQTRIVSVIENAYERIPTEDHNYNTFASISSILERGYSPFSHAGEILAFQGDTDDGIMVSTLKSAEAFEIYGLESMDEIVISRAELLRRIQYIKRIQQSLEPESRVVLNKAEYDFYVGLSYDFQEEGLRGSFGEFLETVKYKMYQAVPKLAAEDTTMQGILKDAGFVSQTGKPIFREIDNIDGGATEKPNVLGYKIQLVSSQ